jgi:hypothetical protein
LIAKNLGKAERQRLNALKKENNTRYYLYLKQIVDQNNISLKNFEFLNLYFKYLVLSADVNTNLMVSEEVRLKDKIYGFLIITEEQKDLVKFEKVLNFYENFINTSVMSKEALDFMANEKEYADFIVQFLNRNSAYLIWAYSVNKQIATLQRAIVRMKDFYQLAEERNNVLVANTLDKKEKISVMVLGGYHTDGVTQLLRARDISYILISPNVTKDYDTKIYEQRLLGEVKTSNINVNKNIANNKLALVSIYQSGDLDAQKLKERITEILGVEEAGKIAGLGSMDKPALLVQLQLIILNSLRTADLSRAQLKDFFSGMNDVLKEINPSAHYELTFDDISGKITIAGVQSDVSDYIVAPQEKLIKKARLAEQTRLATAMEAERVQQEALKIQSQPVVTPPAPIIIHERNSQSTSGEGLNCLLHASLGINVGGVYQHYKDTDSALHRTQFISFIQQFQTVDALIADPHFANVDEDTIRQAIFERNVPGYDAFFMHENERRAQYDVRMADGGDGSLLSQLNLRLTPQEKTRIWKAILKVQIENLLLGMTMNPNGEIDGGVRNFIESHRLGLTPEAYVHENLNAVWNEYVRLNDVNRQAYLDAGIDAMIISYFFNINIQMVFGYDLRPAPSFNYNPGALLHGGHTVQIANRGVGHFERVTDEIVVYQPQVSSSQSQVKQRIITRVLLENTDIDEVKKFADTKSISRLDMEAYFSVFNEALSQDGPVKEDALKKIDYLYLFNCIVIIFDLMGQKEAQVFIEKYIGNIEITEAVMVVARKWVAGDSVQKSAAIAILEKAKKASSSFFTAADGLLLTTLTTPSLIQPQPTQKVNAVALLAGVAIRNLGLIISPLEIARGIEFAPLEYRVKRISEVPTGVKDPVEQRLIDVYQGISKIISSLPGHNKPISIRKLANREHVLSFLRLDFALDEIILYSQADVDFVKSLSPEEMNAYFAFLTRWEVALAQQKSPALAGTVEDMAKGMETFETAIATSIVEFNVPWNVWKIKYDNFVTDTLVEARKLVNTGRPADTARALALFESAEQRGLLDPTNMQGKLDKVDMRKCKVLNQIDKMKGLHGVGDSVAEINRSDDGSVGGTTTASAELQRLRDYVNNRFDVIKEKVIAGHINPFGIDVVTSLGKGVYRKTIDGRKARIGIYPVAGNPLHWGHLMSALDVIIEENLDKIVFVIAAADPRKSDIAVEAVRNPMCQQVLNLFGEFFEMSTIASGTSIDGERNIFRIMQLNGHTDEYSLHYLVGSDHDKLYAEDEIKLTDIVNRQEGIDISEAGFVKYRLTSAPLVEVKKPLFRGIIPRIADGKLFIAKGNDTILKLRESMAKRKVIFGAEDLVPGSTVVLGSEVLPTEIIIPENAEVHISMIGRSRQDSELAVIVQGVQAQYLVSAGIAYNPNTVLRHPTQPGFSAASTDLRNAFLTKNPKTNAPVSPAYFWLLPIVELEYIVKQASLYNMEQILKDEMLHQTKLLYSQIGQTGIAMLGAVASGVIARLAEVPAKIGTLAVETVTQGVSNPFSALTEQQRLMLEEMRKGLLLVENRSVFVGDELVAIKEAVNLALQPPVVADLSRVQLKVIQTETVGIELAKEAGIWTITARDLEILNMMPPALRTEYIKYVTKHEMLEDILKAQSIHPEKAHEITVNLLGKEEYQKWQMVLGLYNRILSLKTARAFDLDTIAGLETLLFNIQTLTIDEMYDAQKRLDLRFEFLDAIVKEEIIIETEGRTLGQIQAQEFGQIDLKGKTIVLRGDIGGFVADILNNVAELDRLSTLVMQNGGKFMYVPGIVVKDNIAEAVKGNVKLQDLIEERVISPSAYLSTSNAIVMAPGTAVYADLYELAKQIVGPQFNDSNSAKKINFILHLFYKAELGLTQKIEPSILQKLQLEPNALILRRTLTSAVIADIAQLKASVLKQFVISGPEVAQAVWKSVVDPTQAEAVNKVKALVQANVTVVALSVDGLSVQVKEGVNAVIATAVEIPVLTTKPPVILSLSDVTTVNATLLRILHASGLLHDKGVLAQLGPIVQTMLLPFVAEKRKTRQLNISQALHEDDVKAMELLASAA